MTLWLGSSEKRSSVSVLKLTSHVFFCFNPSGLSDLTKNVNVNITGCKSFSLFLLENKMKPVASLQKENISKISMNVLPTGLPLRYICVICGDGATHATFDGLSS